MELIQPPRRRNSGISPGNGFWFHPPAFAVELSGEWCDTRRLYLWMRTNWGVDARWFSAAWNARLAPDHFICTRSRHSVTATFYYAWKWCAEEKRTERKRRAKVKERYWIQRYSIHLPRLLGLRESHIGETWRSKPRVKVNMDGNERKR